MSDRPYSGNDRRDNRSGRGFRSFRSVNVKVDEEYDVKIEDISRRGDSGVTRIEGLVVFVNGTKPGDSVKVKIVKVGNGYAVGEVVTGTGSSENTESTGSMESSENTESTENK